MDPFDAYVYVSFYWKCRIPKIRQIEKLTCLDISQYKFKLRFWFNLNLYRETWVFRSGGFRGVQYFQWNLSYMNLFIGVVQCVAVCCSVLQRVAVCCRCIYMCDTTHSCVWHDSGWWTRLMNTHVKCIMLSLRRVTHVVALATHCNVLQHTATHMTQVGGLVRWLNTWHI